MNEEKYLEQLAEVAKGINKTGEVPTGFMRVVVPLTFIDQLYPDGIPEEVFVLSNTDNAPDGFMEVVLPNEIARELARIGLTSDWAVNVFPKPLLMLVQGYLDYAKLLLLDRAVPSIDGLKQSQRRILFTLHEKKIKVDKPIKSAIFAAAVLEYHPHNDDVIYETAGRMVSSAHYTRVPFFEGDGSFGHRNQSGSLPAPRYTALKPNKLTTFLFNELQGTEWGKTEDGIPEPNLIPMKFPYGLMTPSSGVGLGAGSRYLSYAPHEVIDYFVEVIDNGSSDRVLVPDFPTGAMIKNNPKAFRKIMDSGIGTVEVTCKWEVSGKTIKVTQMHNYTHVAKLKREIEDLELFSVARVVELTGYEIKPSLEITCKSESVVDYTLKRILKETSMHDSVSSNMLTVIDRQPRVIGVAEYTKEWLKFRSGVIKKFYTLQVEGIVANVKTLEFLIKVTSDQALVQQVIDASLKSKQEGAEVLRNRYPDATKEEIESVMALRISSLAERDSRKTRLANLQAEMSNMQKHIENPLPLIRKELLEMKQELPSGRLTDITEEDYSYRKEQVLTEAEQEVLDRDYRVFIEDGFIFRYVEGEKILKQREKEGKPAGYTVKDTDYILIADREERLVRIPVKDIPCVNGSTGLYVQSYAGFDLSKGGAKLLMYFVMEKDKTETILYKDGYVSVINHNEWLDCAYVTKVTQKGLPQGYSGMAVGTLDKTKEYTVIQTTEGRIAVAENDFKEKARTARTRLITGMNKNRNEQVARGVAVTVQELKMLFRENNNLLVDAYKLNRYDTSEFDYEAFDTLQETTN